MSTVDIRAKHLFLKGYGIEDVSLATGITHSLSIEIFKQIEYPGLRGVCFGSKNSPYCSEEEALNSPVYCVEDLKGEELDIYNSLCINLSTITHEYQIFNPRTKGSSFKMSGKSEISEDYCRKFYVKQVA